MNEHKNKTFDTQIGSEAVVEHVPLPQDEYTAQLAEVLKDIGLDMQKVGKVPQGMTYAGSLAVHIFTAPLTRQFAFAGQVAMEPDTHFKVAEAGVKKLAQDVNQHYSGSRQKLRSGF